MKIAIVSARKHCKSHITALRRDGYDVRCLGASPTKIPPSYEVVVMRTSSCSHGGSATVLSWSRETGRPLIVHDGLSSIRRDLKALNGQNGAPIPSPRIPRSPAKVRKDLMEWTATLRLTHPDWSRWKAEATLQETLRAQIPDVGSECLGMIPQVLDEFFECLEPIPPTPPTPTSKEQAPMLTPPTPRGPFPHEAKWATLYTAPKLEGAFHEASHIIEGLTDNKKKKFARLYLACESPGVREGDYTALAKVSPTPSFAGKPLTYTAFVYLLHPKNHAAKKRTFFLTYRHLTGKGMDTRIPDAVSWFLGHPEPVKAVAAVKGEATKARTVSAETRRAERDTVRSVGPQDLGASRSLRVQGTEDVPRPPSDTLAAEVKEHADFILSMVEEIDTLKGAVAGLQQELTEGLVDLGKTLREGSVAPPQTDPFASLESLKERLRDFGFRGTLTLTIE